MRHRRSPLLLVLAVLGGAFAREEPGERWYRIEMGGVRVGHRHDSVRAGTATGELLIRESAVRMKMKRYGSEIEIEAESLVVEGEGGRPIRFTSRMKFSREATVTRGEVAGGKLKLVTAVMGRETTREIEFPDGALVSGQEEAWMRRVGFAAGASGEVKVFSPELGGMATVAVEVLGDEETDLPSGRARLTKVKLTMDLMPGMVSHYWFDGKGEVRKEWTGIGDYTVHRVSREEALEPVKPSAGADIGFGNMLRSNVAIPLPYETTEVVYRLTMRGSDFEGIVLEDDRQRVEEDGGEAVRLRVRSLVPAGGTPARPVKAPEVQAYLAETPSLPWKDEAVLRVAQEAAGEEKDSWGAAKLLEDWVHRNVRVKSFDVGLAGALEVLRDREGDCSEHATLLAALLRAAGIPSRIAVGLLYVRKEFGYHMWTEAWVGRWTALDGTLGLGRVGATHIKLGESGEKEEEGLAAFAGVAKALGRLEIEVLEFTVGGRRVQASDPGEAWVEEGGALRHVVHRLSLKVPEGWEVGMRGAVGDDELLRLHRGGGEEKIRLRVLNVGAVADLREFARRHIEGAEDFRDLAVDGRPALEVAVKGEGDAPGGRGVMLLLGATIFTFRLEPATEGGRVGFEALLASVRFGAARGR